MKAYQEKWNIQISFWSIFSFQRVFKVKISYISEQMGDTIEHVL